MQLDSRRVVSLQIGDNALDVDSGVADALATDADQLCGAAHLTPEPIDIDGITFELGQDRFELGDRAGIADRSRSFVPARHVARLGQTRAPLITGR